MICITIAPKNEIVIYTNNYILLQTVCIKNAVLH